MTPLAALLACTLVAPEPELREVVPARGWTGEDTPVTIMGTRLLPAVKVDGSGGSVDTTFGAWIVREAEEVPLMGVSLVDVGTLAAVVPEGLAAGPWDLRVRTPGGVEGRLDAAFTVTETRADHLDLSVETAAWTAGETARVTVRLLDPDGVRVAEPSLVEVYAASPTGAGGVTFLDGGLDGQRPTESGVGLRGRLDEDGEGTLLVRSESPDDVTVRVSSLSDPEGIRGDELLLSWSAGSVADVDVELPAAAFEATAGEPFSVDLVLRDALGNVLDDDPLDVLIYDGCGDLREGRTVRGRTSLTLTLHRACERNTIHVFAEGSEWESATFPVLPGALASYRVNASRSVVTAGVDDLGVLVSAVDAWDNVVFAAATEVSLRDTLGGLDTGTAAGMAQCAGFPAEGPAVQLCNVTLERAGEVRLVAEDTEGRSGTSSPLTVVPGPAAYLELGVDAPTRAAGESFVLRVDAEDAFGNVADPYGVALMDDSGTLACVEDLPDGTSARYSCVITAAGSTVVAGTLEDAYAETVVEIVNGVLAAVELAPRATSMVAGETVTLACAAWDAWGNPWLVQDDPVVALDADLGVPDPASVHFESDGTATADVRLTTAGDVRVQATRAGVVLGEASPVRVAPATPSALRVDVDGWVSVDAPFDVEVQAIDAWGNATAMPSGDLAITGTAGECAHAAARLVDGVGSVELVCGAASLDTELTVSGAGLSGSAVVDILDLACPTGPTANLLLDGAEDAVTCGDTVVASVAESVPGDAAIDRVWLQVGEGSWAVTAEDGGIANLGTTGIHVVRAVVADDRGCGDLDEAVAWAGRDDGSATGPITVAGPAIASDGDTVTMAVVATTCSGAVAAGDMVGVRAGVGAPVVGATGDGLALTLDTGGASTFAWRVDHGHGGPATLQVGTATAWGTASVVVAGDTVAPRIVTYSYEAGETVTLQFSEPMDIASVALALDGAPVPVAWDADDVRATVDVSGVGGVPFTVYVDPTSVDLAGNTLADADRVRFGSADSGVDTPAACAASLARFTPDGDDGAGTAADQVTVTWSAAADPAAWVWRVFQDGEVVRAGRESGSARALLWDGRGDDGRIVEAGAYAIEVRAVAPDAAEGSACAAYVGVRETFTAPAMTR